MSSVSDYLRGLPPAHHRQLREQVTAALLAVDLCRRCVESPGAQSETVPQLQRYVRQAIRALQTLDDRLPTEG